MKQVTILKNEPFRIRSLRIFLEKEAAVQPLLIMFNEKWSDVPERRFPYAHMYNAQILIKSLL